MQEQTPEDGRTYIYSLFAFVSQVKQLFSLNPLQVRLKTKVK